ncbi:tail collar domain [Caudoviricetes sp.]|nr:tail collar domain [Caudoviricetes sp.]
MALTKVPLSLLDTPGPAGNVLQSDGTNWTSATPATPASIPTGMIIPSSYYQATTTGASGTGSVATITFTPAYTIPVGSTVTIAGVTPSGYNGVYTVTASSSGSVSFASSTTGSQTVAGTATATPQGFLLCDGSIYTSSSYPTLAAYIGTPVVPTNITNSYTNAAFTITDQCVRGANNVLFATGSAAAKSAAAATANALYTSTDGITWTSRTAWNLANDVYAASRPDEERIAYGGGVYVATTLSSNTNYTVQYSSDLVTWSKANLSGTDASAQYTTMVAFGGTSNVFITQGYATNGCSSALSAIQYSTNGSSWSTVTVGAGLSTTYYLSSAAGYSGALLYINYVSPTVYKLAYSATGTSFTDITSDITTGLPYCISYANGRFIVSTSTNAIFTSTTGATGTWTRVTTSGPSPSKIRWNGTAYVTASGYYSTDLINWGTSSVTTTYGVSAVANSNKLYSRIGTAFYWWDFNSYTAGTQFPVPKIVSAVGISTSLLNSPFNATRYYIKT